ncbi:hypothetical protein ElyMa_006593600 [Elysia marginata]|uniref:Uncharacterized protein n=1 Tax=Elysia marginata TaxID=1093978 RepID=A0AAV4IFT3_9GAST|nr:hypothetical protein ElyMa_006593600 [Elysia marginata]
MSSYDFPVSSPRNSATQSNSSESTPEVASLRNSSVHLTFLSLIQEFPVLEIQFSLTRLLILFQKYLCVLILAKITNLMCLWKQTPVSILAADLVLVDYSICLPLKLNPATQQALAFLEDSATTLPGKSIVNKKTLQQKKVLPKRLKHMH